MAAVVVTVERRLHFTAQVGLYFPRPFHTAPRQPQMGSIQCVSAAHSSDRTAGLSAGVAWGASPRPPTATRRALAQRGVSQSIAEMLCERRERIISTEASSFGAMPMYSSPSSGCVGCAEVGTEGNVASSVSYHA